MAKNELKLKDITEKGHRKEIGSFVKAKLDKDKKARNRLVSRILGSGGKLNNVDFGRVFRELGDLQDTAERKGKDQHKKLKEKFVEAIQLALPKAISQITEDIKRGKYKGLKKKKAVEALDVLYRQGFQGIGIKNRDGIKGKERKKAAEMIKSLVARKFRRNALQALVGKITNKSQKNIPKWAANLSAKQGKKDKIKSALKSIKDNKKL